MKTKIKAYMCGTNWSHEMDEDNVCPVEISANPAVIEDHGGECGIVELEVKFIRWHESRKMNKD